MPSHTAQYWFIEIALHAHAASLLALAQEMDRWQPLSLDAFEEDRQQMWDQMRPLNKDKSDDDLKSFIQRQISLGGSPAAQFRKRFTESFAAEAVAITVLSHALVEATINTALALGLEHSGKPTLFLIIEAADVKHKWTIGPQSFLARYDLPKADLLYGVLSRLCRDRNAFVHSKITIRDDSQQIVLKGSPVARLSMDANGRQLLRRYLALPYNLLDQLLNQVEDKTLHFRLEHILSRRNGSIP